MSHKQHKLSIVGAGPGDPDLITLKAIKTLAQADVVLYDALANKDLLSHCRADVIKIFVGKKAGEHVYQQEKINELIVVNAKQYGHVVRLKGGDPYVFGRGHEELLFAEKHGLEVDLVPGITSAISVPALNNMPLTFRGINESFWVMTAVTSDGQLSSDLTLATQSTATVVILMGLNRIADIMKIYIDHGKSDVPVAVIQNGSLPSQKVIIATAATIAQQCKQANMGSPALIVVGETVNLGKEKLANALYKNAVDNKDGSLS